jgi:pimeloyl-ACP methyl ester carboxylesterase
MTERPVWFGAKKSLSGVLTEPPQGRTGLPAALLLNAGFLHRVGPNRLYVTLARRLAALGVPVLRFDYSGLGESPPREDGLPLKQTLLTEGIEAMDFLVASGVADEFVPMGLCWGGENAQRLAGADDRVVGAALIDGYAYRTIGYYLRHWGRHLVSPRSWRRIVSRSTTTVIRHLRDLGSPPSPEPFERNPGGVNFVRKFPPKDSYLDEMRRILARQAELLLVFTGGGMVEHYNHVRQFGEAFPSLRGDPRLRVEYLPLADHTLTLRSQQDALVASISSWVGARFLGRATGLQGGGAAIVVTPAPAQ